MAGGSPSDEGWPPLVSAIISDPDEVRVVRLLLDAPSSDDLLDLLSADERERAARFVFDVHRRRFVAARAGLRRVLGRCLGRDPAGLVFEYTDRGRPSLALAKGPAIDFNLAHSGELALLALSRGTVGVDVEQLRAMENALAIAERFFSPREVESLTRLPPEQRTRGFFNAWTRKEAVIKGTGAGLGALEETEVSLAPDEPPTIVRAPGGADAWQLFHLDPSPGYVGAVAVRAGTSVQLTTWSGP